MRREVLSSELILPFLLPFPSSFLPPVLFSFTSFPLVQIFRSFYVSHSHFLPFSPFSLFWLLEITFVATPLLRVSLSLFFRSCVPPLLLLCSSYSASSALSSLPLLRGNLLLQCVSRSKLQFRKENSIFMRLLFHYPSRTRTSFHSIYR